MTNLEHRENSTRMRTHTNTNTREALRNRDTTAEVESHRLEVEPSPARVHVVLVQPLKLAKLGIKGALLEALKSEGETGAQLLHGFMIQIPVQLDDFDWLTHVFDMRLTHRVIIQGSGILWRDARQCQGFQCSFEGQHILHLTWQVFKLAVSYTACSQA